MTSILITNKPIKGQKGSVMYECSCGVLRTQYTNKEGMCEECGHIFDFKVNKIKYAYEVFENCSSNIKSNN